MIRSQRKRRRTRKIKKIKRIKRRRKKELRAMTKELDLGLNLMMENLWLRRVRIR